MLEELLVDSKDRGAQIRPNPYWSEDIMYNPLEVFGTAIQCFDQHVSELPQSTLPPEDDIRSFINVVASRGRPVTITDQFKIAMDLSRGDILGAANVAMLSTRLMARAADKRAYPGISATKDEIEQWRSSVAQFEVGDVRLAPHDTTITSDPLGDTYYFWTHCFAAVAYSLPHMCHHVSGRIFEHGTDIMKFVRKHVARRPNITAHFESSLLGRNAGLALARGFWENDWGTGTESKVEVKSTTTM